LDMLDRVDAKSVEIEIRDPMNGVGNELLLDIDLRPIDVGEVWLEEAIERTLAPPTARIPAFTLSAEPARDWRYVFVILVDLVVDEIEQNPKPASVRLVDELAKGRVTTESRLDFTCPDRPIAVVAAVPLVAVADLALARLHVERREPER